MAHLRPWVPHIEAFVGSSISPSVEQQNASLNNIAAQVKSEVLTIQALVREMELYLTTTDGLIRGRGVTLLGEVLARLSTKHFDPVTVHSLIEFFTSKLADWQAVHGALVGCLALLKRMHPISTVAGIDAKGLAQCFLQDLQVQTLALDDRKMCFELLQYLLDQYSQDVATLGEQLVLGILDAIDHEKDPTCLMLTFHIAESLGKVFPDSSGPVATHAEELFDILGCYFPIYFVHPKADDLTVKRDDLSVSLMNAFCSTSFFEPFSIPLLLEKLSSDLPLAKIDSLKYLSNCLLQYDADQMTKHSKDIWTSLKDAIFHNSPCELLSVPGSLKNKESRESEVYTEAIACFQNALFLLNRNGSFIKWVISDEEFDICLSSMASELSYHSLSVENRRKLHAVGIVLSASIKASNDCCNEVFQRFFPRLMGILGIFPLKAYSNNTNMKRNTTQKLAFGSFYLCVEMLYSCRLLLLSSKEIPPESIEGTITSLLQSFCTPLAHTLVTLTTDDGSSAPDGAGSWENTYYRVRGMEVLATFPAYYSHISATTYEDILKSLVSTAINGFNDSVIWKHCLNALIRVGEDIEVYDDCDRRSNYSSQVIEIINTLLQNEDCELPLMLKLEAALAIGTAGPEFMSRIILQLENLIFAKFIEVFVKGRSNTATAFVPLLNYYSSKVLGRHKGVKVLQEAPKRFVLNVWNALESNHIPETYSLGQSAKALMTAMKMAFSYCDEGNQLMLLYRGYNIIRPTIISLSKDIAQCGYQDQSVCLSYKEKLLKALFASMLIAVRPEVALPDAEIILRWLKIFLLRGHKLEAQALASIINKLPGIVKSESALCPIADAIDIVFDLDLSNAYENLSFQQSNTLDSDQRTCGSVSDLDGSAKDLIVGLAWIGKGLLMRGHEKVKDVTVLLLKHLLSGTPTSCTVVNASRANGNGVVSESFLAQSAADAFQILLSDSDVCLNKNFHAILKPLYKQKFFTTITPILLSAIKESDSPKTRVNLYQALGHVISNTPLSAFVNEAKKLMLPLLEAMHHMSVDVAYKDLVYNLLLVLSGILMDEIGKEAIVENAHIVTTRIISLTSYPHKMLVRETATQCLVAISELPHSRIYPMRKQVLKAMTRALDDPKWLVRREAAKCHRTWESMIQG